MTGAIIGHLVGDYLLQNDWMASRKKSESLVCAIHCAIWATCVCVFGLTCNPLIWLALFGTHYVQDRTNIVRKWMTFYGQESFATGPCSPWSIIVVDNVWHMVAIWVLWQL